VPEISTCSALLVILVTLAVVTATSVLVTRNRTDGHSGTGTPSEPGLAFGGVGAGNPARSKSRASERPEDGDVLDAERGVGAAPGE